MGRHAYILVGNFGKVTDGFARKGRVMVRVSVVCGPKGPHGIARGRSGEQRRGHAARPRTRRRRRPDPNSPPTTPMWWWSSPCRPFQPRTTCSTPDAAGAWTWWSAPPAGPTRDSPRSRRRIADGSRGPKPRRCSSRPTSPIFRRAGRLLCRQGRRAVLRVRGGHRTGLHPTKVDAPSGTAIHTARGIAGCAQGGRPRRRAGRHRDGWRLARPGGRRRARARRASARAQRARGGAASATRASSSTIRADSFDRTSFMPGVLLAVRKVAGGGPAGLTVGLDQFLDL